MTAWEAFLLGVVQGATEFLPVSSSGHLVMAQEVLDIHVAGILFEVTVHLATLLSIAMVYRGRLVELLRGAAGGKPEAHAYIGLLVLATLPAGLIGVLFRHRIEALFDNPYATGMALLVTGGLLWSSRTALEHARKERPGWRAALLIGVAQAFAVVPGISRSGATVVAALWLGVEAREAAAFSFLMALPAIGGAAVLQIPELSEATTIAGATLAVGGVAAAVTGVLAIRTFVALLGRRAFHWFAPYCWAIGAAFLLYLGVR